MDQPRLPGRLAESAERSLFRVEADLRRPDHLRRLRGHGQAQQNTLLAHAAAAGQVLHTGVRQIPAGGRGDGPHHLRVRAENFCDKGQLCHAPFRRYAAELARIVRELFQINYHLGIHIRHLKDRFCRSRRTAASG